MRFSQFLEKHQPLLHKSLVEAFSNHKISHAYLLTGESGTPLKETAYFIAKSLLCDHANPLADETCPTCERVEHNLYTDLLFLDGSKGSIKKDDVSFLVSDFAKTPNEAKGVMVYIIHLVENMTSEAVNALLKFLEEPTDNCYAILTSQNPARILPTIISRCETMRLLLLPTSEVIDEAISNGVEKSDAEILSHFCNSGDIIALEKDTDAYKRAKSAFLVAIQALSTSREECIFRFEKDIAELVVNKEGCRYFLDMLSLAYHDLISMRYGDEVTLSCYNDLLQSLQSRIKNPEKGLELILEVRGELDLNLSPALLLDHLSNELTKE